MPKDDDFDQSVFVNCPLDEDYDRILRAILFCLARFGLKPRIAAERSNAGEPRISKILDLVQSSRYSIHDLSRCQARDRGEYYRLNMPFELGLDFGCRRYGVGRLTDKTILRARGEAGGRARSGDDRGVRRASDPGATGGGAGVLEPEPGAVRRAVENLRGRREIEHRRHYVRDVSYDEDRNRVRAKRLRRNLACLANAAISIVRLDERFDYVPQAHRHFAARQGDAMRQITRRGFGR